MAKPQQQRRKARPSWFMRQIERGGNDFLLRKSPQEIQRESLNIVRDIMRGNVTQRDFQYLFDMKILSNTRLSVFNDYVKIHAYDSAMLFVMNTPNAIQYLETANNIDQETFQNTFNENRTKLSAYLALLNALDTLIGFVQSPNQKTEEDYKQVYSTIQYQLSKFRYVI